MHGHTTKSQLDWRGLSITIFYDHKLWGRDLDRFYIKAKQPFHTGGDDYIMRWLASLERPFEDAEILALAEMWLDDALESSGCWREGDCVRNQLMLF
tara:strand:- start:22644 stop:22934 length:291 start_codon:yes stop_codon:yes gene_type:complete